MPEGTPQNEARRALVDAIAPESFRRTVARVLQPLGLVLHSNAMRKDGPEEGWYDFLLDAADRREEPGGNHWRSQIFRSATASIPINRRGPLVYLFSARYPQQTEMWTAQAAEIPNPAEPNFEDERTAIWERLSTHLDSGGSIIVTGFSQRTIDETQHRLADEHELVTYIEEQEGTDGVVDNILMLSPTEGKAIRIKERRIADLLTLARSALAEGKSTFDTPVLTTDPDLVDAAMLKFEQETGIPVFKTTVETSGGARGVRRQTLEFVKPTPPSLPDEEPVAQEVRYKIEVIAGDLDSQSLQELRRLVEQGDLLSFALKFSQTFSQNDEVRLNRLVQQVINQAKKYGDRPLEAYAEKLRDNIRNKLPGFDARESLSLNLPNLNELEPN